MADEPTETPTETPTPTPTPTPIQQDKPGPGWEDFTKLQTEMATLPERIINSMREAFPPPPKPKETPAPAKETVKETPKQDAQQPGKRTFGEWWFGG